MVEETINKKISAYHSFIKAKLNKFADESENEDSLFQRYQAASKKIKAILDDFENQYIGEEIKFTEGYEASTSESESDLEFAEEEIAAPTSESNKLLNGNGADFDLEVFKAELIREGTDRLEHLKKTNEKRERKQLKEERKRIREKKKEARTEERKKIEEKNRSREKVFADYDLTYLHKAIENFYASLDYLDSKELDVNATLQKLTDEISLLESFLSTEKEYFAQNEHPAAFEKNTAYRKLTDNVSRCEEISLKCGDLLDQIECLDKVEVKKQKDLANQVLVDIQNNFRRIEAEVKKTASNSVFISNRLKKLLETIYSLFSDLRNKIENMPLGNYNYNDLSIDLNTIQSRLSEIDALRETEKSASNIEQSMPVDSPAPQQPQSQVRIGQKDFPISKKEVSDTDVENNLLLSNLRQVTENFENSVKGFVDAVNGLEESSDVKSHNQRVQEILNNENTKVITQIEAYNKVTQKISNVIQNDFSGTKDLRAARDECAEKYYAAYARYKESKEKLKPRQVKVESKQPVRSKSIAPIELAEMKKIVKNYELYQAKLQCKDGDFQIGLQGLQDCVNEAQVFFSLSRITAMQARSKKSIAKRLQEKSNNLKNTSQELDSMLSDRGILNLVSENLVEIGTEYLAQYNHEDENTYNAIYSESQKQLQRLSKRITVVQRELTAIKSNLDNLAEQESKLSEQLQKNTVSSQVKIEHRIQDFRLVTELVLDSPFNMNETIYVNAGVRQDNAVSYTKALTEQGSHIDIVYDKDLNLSNDEELELAISAMLDYINSNTINKKNKFPIEGTADKINDYILIAKAKGIPADHLECREIRFVHDGKEELVNYDAQCKACYQNAGQENHEVRARYLAIKNKLELRQVIYTIESSIPPQSEDNIIIEDADAKKEGKKQVISDALAEQRIKSSLGDKRKHNDYKSVHSSYLSTQTFFAGEKVNKFKEEVTQLNQGTREKLEQRKAKTCTF